VAGNIFHGDNPFDLYAIFRLEALDGAWQFEMETGAVFGLKRSLTVQSPANVDHVEGFGHGVANGPAPVGGGKIEPVGHRSPEIRAGLNPGQPVFDP
jgi:hypothetical protein